VNQGVKANITYLKDHMVITSFVGKRPSSLALNFWLTYVNNKIEDGQVGFNYTLGKGFMLLKTNGPNTFQKVLMLTPFRSSWGMNIFQKWVPCFSPEQPKRNENSHLGYYAEAPIGV
jgi:hypothetical protein